MAIMALVGWPVERDMSMSPRNEAVIMFPPSIMRM